MKFFLFPFLLCCCLILSSFAVTAKDVTTSPKIKAIAFDAFPVFDPRVIANKAEEIFPGQGKQLMELWRTRMFEYQWLRALGGQYKDFMVTAEDGLVFAAKQLNLDLTAEKKEKLLNEFMNLKIWPDAPAALRKLNDMGIKLVFLSNMTEQMLRNGLRNAGLEKEFALILSTDAVSSYKPDPTAYALAVDQLKMSKQEILFVAFAGWDAAGADWYGYPTFWVNRTGASAEELDATIEGSSKDLSGLVEFVLQQNAER